MKVIIVIICLFVKNEIKNLIKIFSPIKLNLKKKDLNNQKFDFFTKFQKGTKSKKKILISGFSDLYDYLKYEYLIAVNLSNIEKKSITVLLEEKDYVTKNFFLKKGIDSFLYYKNKPIFFLRVGYLIKAYNLIHNIKSIENFINFKYEGLPTGKLVYSHVARFARIPTFKKIDYRFYNTLAIYLHFAKEFTQIIKKNSFEHFIQAETQFIPPAVFMAYALKKKKTMFSRIGLNQKISVRQINNVKYCLEDRSKYDTRLFYNLKNNHKNKAIKIGKKIINDRFKGLNIPDREIDKEGIKLAKNNKIKFIDNYDKKFICKKFNWDIAKPIGIIFANDLTDGLFLVKSCIFSDNYIWLEEILNMISLNQKMNWLVKSHPSDFKNEGKLKSKNLFFSKKNLAHVKHYPENWGRKHLHKIVDIVFTNYGTAGYEYPAMGIPAVITGESNYSGAKIAHQIKSKKELLNKILNCHKTKKLKKPNIENAQIFAYLENVFTKVKLDLATLDNVEVAKNPKKYWKIFEKNLQKSQIYKFNSIEIDSFYKSFKYQIDKKLKHTINKKLF